jgi:hypothetical protein
MRASGKEAVLTLDGVAVLSVAVLWRRHLLDGGDDPALIAVLHAAAGTGAIAAAADEGFVGFEKAVQQAGRVLTEPVAQLVSPGPGGPVGDPELALQKLGLDAAFVAAHQIGGDKPLREIGARPMKYRPSRHRFLPVAGGAFVDPPPRLQPPSLPSTACGIGKPSRPANPSQMLDALPLCPKARRKLQKPAIPSPLFDRCYATLRRGQPQEHLAKRMSRFVQMH